MRLRSILPVAILVLLVAGVAVASTPTQYATVVEALEAGGDYSVEDGTLAVVFKEPLHIAPVSVHLN